ncbi:RHS repeat-associated core domain-containing protein [Flavobacterium sp. F-65]|uniref:RHS repeat-associated core domain-containing protein n=1 Tax=Flavobacterium pisciphilum TaxID=2893755 RepID=A0ABS8MQ62_9FLAO|nr:RHS repeat-associated core domain-containing protein [Flavobacterium sp. F-65]MCC9070893.1 RHS repeat-associated core domain-containing protein [Flavobacterium sp. F-65]
MKKYIYYIILFPIFIFANSDINNTSNYISHNLDAFGNYPNYSITISSTELFTGSGGGGGKISVDNNVLTVYFSGGWTQQPLKTGVIKVLTISPSLPDIELGPVTTSATNYPNAYNAKIENNSLIIYSTADVLSSISTNITTSPSNYAAGVDYTASLPNIFNCTDEEGNSNGTITIKKGTVTLNMNGTWPSKCNIKTGQILYLDTGVPLRNTELGIIKQGSTDTNYRARIVSNFLIFYNIEASPPLTTTASLNVIKDLNEGSELLIPNDYSNNWIHAVSYDIKGQVIGQSRSYFDDLGKSDVTLSKNYVTNQIWGTETTYDDFARPDRTSFIAPSPLDSFEKTNFLKNSTQIESYPSSLSLGAITSSKDYKATQSITANGTISPGLTVSLTSPSIVLSNGFILTATSGSNFKATAAILSDASTHPSLANYYSDNNTEELYQATATHPFAQNNYDQLNPGNVINVTGGNKINDEWKTGYSFTVPAAQEMYYIFGTDYFNNDRDPESYTTVAKYPEYDNKGLSAYFIKIIPSENQVLPIESIPGGNLNIMLQVGGRPYTIKANSPLERGKLYKMLVGGKSEIVQILNEINYRKAIENNSPGIDNPIKIISGSWDTYTEVNHLNQISDVLNNTDNIIVGLKCLKTINIDPNGIENVSFIDTDGKSLASARSGGAIQYKVASLIGDQGFIDVHLPKGCEGTLSYFGGAALYKVYDLKIGRALSDSEKNNLQAGIYRIELISKTPQLSLAYINKTDGSINNVSPDAKGVTYNVNYYDYAINVHNKTGQVIKSIQPNGYVANTTIVASPSYLSSTNFATTYTYNSLGQLIQVTSSDEGTSKFVYRNDGQIRYSQSALQNDSKISYTDYDSYGRPIESGVIANNWTTAIINPDAALISGTRTEQTFTVYDDAENNRTSVSIPNNLTLSNVLSSAGIANTNYIQNNLSGNVAITYTKPEGTISAISWYSYDIYGRAEWVVQYNEGIGAKTIHYEYDYKGNTKKVIFQKDKSSDFFIHQYSYNENSVLTKVETSIDNINFITHADYSYYKTGELKRVNIAQGTQGLDYVYTLGGQLKSINHPSLEASKDPGGDNNDVFGITLDYYNGDYLRTGRNITSSPTAGADYNGNIKATRWTNKGVPGDFSGNTANQKGYLYNYDRNNWLTTATFGNTNSNTAAIAATNSLVEGGLTYDPNGNIKTLQRTDETGSLIDNLTYNYAGKNQLNSVNDAATTTDITDIKNQNPDNYQYDAIGQLIHNAEENLYYYYNTQGLITEVRKGINPVIKIFYNERGQRVKKESYNTSTFSLQNTTYYILDLSGNAIAIYSLSNGGNIIQTDLPIFGLSRLGVYNKTNATNSYEITDHLGNVRAVIQKTSGNTTIQSYADYYPFGEQLPGRNSLSNYRYAFQGQELDKETGMEAFQLRLWDGRLGRWLNPDPKGIGYSPYIGMANNPINTIDPDGGCPCSQCPENCKGSGVNPITDADNMYPNTSGMQHLEGMTITYGSSKSMQQTNPFTPFDDANNLLTIALNASGALIPLDKYTEALSNSKFIFNYNGVDKLWKMGYHGGGSGKIASSSIQTAKIETQVLGSVGKGIKFTGYSLSALGVLSTERQYQLGYIDNDRRAYDQSLNVINFYFPELALGTIPGNYLGQKYHTQIMNQVTNPNAYLNNTVGNILNFFGVPTSKE